MSVSLIAISGSGRRTEVGRYGMSLERAKALFLIACKDHQIKPRVKADDRHVVFEIDESKGSTHPKSADLLYSLADVTELVGEPPQRYFLAGSEQPADDYERVNPYNG